MPEDDFTRLGPNWSKCFHKIFIFLSCKKYTFAYKLKISNKMLFYAEHLRDKNEDAQGYDKKQSTFKYLYTGFLGLQLTIEKVLTKMLTGNVDFNDTVIKLNSLILIKHYNSLCNNQH